MQMQRMGPIPIVGIIVNIIIDTILKFYANADEDSNVNIDSQCEHTFSQSVHRHEDNRGSHSRTHASLMKLFISVLSTLSEKT